MVVVLPPVAVVVTTVPPPVPVGVVPELPPVEAELPPVPFATLDPPEASDPPTDVDPAAPSSSRHSGVVHSPAWVVVLVLQAMVIVAKRTGKMKYLVI